MKQYQKQRDWTPKLWKLELSFPWRTSGRGQREQGSMTASVQLMERTVLNERWEGLCPLSQASFGMLDCPCKSFHPLSLSLHCSTGSMHSSVTSSLWMPLSDVWVQSPLSQHTWAFWLWFFFFFLFLTGILAFLIYVCFIMQSGSFNLCRRWKELKSYISLFVNLLTQLIWYLLIVLSDSDFYLKANINKQHYVVLKGNEWHELLKCFLQIEE